MFDPQGGRQVDQAWIWPCGCVVQPVRHATRELLARACTPDHDDPLDELLVVTALKLPTMPEIVRVYPNTN